MPSADGFGAFVGGGVDTTRSSVRHCPARQASENKKRTKSTPIDPRSVERLQVLAALKLPPEVLFPELFPRLRRLVPAATCTAYWRGSNQFLAHCYEESDSRVRLSPPSIDSLRNLRWLISHMDTARGLATADGFHRLNVPMHSAGEIAGFICLHRHAEDGPFQINEQAAVIRLARGIVVSQEPPSFAEYLTAPISAGLYTLSDTGVPLFACDDGHRTLQLAGFEHFEHAVRETPLEVYSCTAERGSYHWERRNACGLFEFSARRMQASAGQQPATLIVSITRHTPIGLVVVRNAEKLELTSKQTVVAIAVVHGDSYEAIAARLNIRPSTAIEHVRNLQTRLHARNRAELITRLVVG